MEFKDGAHRPDEPYSSKDLATCARWLGYSGCANAERAVELAVQKRLDLFAILVAWETRLFGTRERQLRIDQIHDLDEFDGILEELAILDAARRR